MVVTSLHGFHGLVNPYPEPRSLVDTHLGIWKATGSGFECDSCPPLFAPNGSLSVSLFGVHWWWCVSGVPLFILITVGVSWLLHGRIVEPPHPS